MKGHIECGICEGAGKLNLSNDICKVYSNVRYFKEEAFTVWRCPSCNSLHSLEDVDLGLYYKHYPLQQHTLDLWARIAYRNRLHRLVKEGLKRNQKILDYGCGQGLFVTYLLEMNYESVVGYDAYVEKYNSQAHLLETYDSVNAQDVIEHADDPAEMMEKLSELLNPGGLLYIGTPNADRINLGKPEDFMLSLHQPYHRHIFSEKALVSLGESYGLKLLRIYSRWYYDTLFPTVNHRFLQEYVRCADNYLDSAFEDPKVGMVLKSPMLMFYSLFGYFFPPRTEMAVLFRKT